ncbi:MAG: outer membrane protein assembly factor BamA [Myxococcales bacterium]|nr:outer membrane protein assembly factor BamA [Myxococcales bacterium]
MIRALWLCVALLGAGGLLGAPAARAQAITPTIDEVRVEGNRRSEADAILGVVQSRAGTVLDRARVRGDIRAIFLLGFYTDVQVDLTRVDGKEVLTFRVVEKPSIRNVVYEGNDELDDDELGEVVDIKAYGILDLAKVNRNAEKIRDLYVEKGYFLAEVDWEVVDLPDNQVDVVFKVTEKQEVKVARITIVGNKQLSDAYIKERLETREGGFLSFLTGAGSFQTEAFSRDQLRINQFYYDQGYIKARTGTPRVELSPDKSELFLTIPVEEGERYKTGEVDVTGDFLAEHPKDEVMGLVTLKKGEWFSSTQLRDTINAIGELYKDEGYAYVNIVPNTLVDDEKRIVDLSIDIEKGNKVRIGRIRIQGNTRTRDKVIRREMRIYEGEYYSSSGLRRSERLITRLGFFETVNITTNRGAEEGTMDVLVDVKEKPTGTFQIGAGFSSIESFVAQAQIAQNNLFGRGQSLSLQATLSKIRTIANVRFADDYFLDTKVRFATNVYRFETNFEDFTRESLGGDLTLGYPLSDDWSVAVTYTLEQVDVRLGGFGSSRAAVPIANLFNNGLTSSLRFSLFYDTRNNRLFPSSGIFASASAENANEFLGSENLFTRYQVRGRYYYDLGFDITLKLNAQWGLITSPLRTGVPIFERFFVGGPLTVRGFRRNTLGPTIGVPDAARPDSGTEPFNIGGTEQWIGNAEVEFPIFQRVGIRGVLFLDGGNAFDRRDDVTDKFSELRYSWGFGIRWFSPIGPLRFEWGFPFAPREDEESSVFDFSIGNFF